MFKFMNVLIGLLVNFAVLHFLLHMIVGFIIADKRLLTPSWDYINTADQEVIHYNQSRQILAIWLNAVNIIINSWRSRYVIIIYLKCNITNILY